LTINKCHTGCILSMPIAQSKRKLIAGTALVIAVAALTASIGMVGTATISLAQTTSSETGGNTTTAREQPGEHHQQGTITSSPSPLPGQEDTESAMILAPTPRGAIYSGQITYTSSEPVQVTVLQVQDLNATERQMLNATDSPFGTLPTSQLDNQTSVVVTNIGTPSAAASVWFAGNAVLLSSTDGTPFVATYTLSADEHRPSVENRISNATTATTEGGGGDEDGGGE
jgi:nucleoside diphosphate kinase